MEEELNNQLNVFSLNYAAAYGGFNDVKTQLGCNSDAGKKVESSIVVAHVEGKVRTYDINI